MKNHYYLHILLLISACSFAQKPILSNDFTFQIGEKYKKVRNLESYYFTVANSLASFKKERNRITIQRFSLEDLKEDIKKRQVIEDKGDFQTVMKFGARAVIFYAANDKAYAQGTSITGKIADKPVLLVGDDDIFYDFGFKGTYGYDAGGRINKFAFKKSFDDSKLLVLYRIKTDDDVPDILGINIFNPNLELIWKKKVSLPYATNIIENEDFAIDNEGNFYMSASIFSPDTKNKSKLEESYTTEVFKITESDTEFSKSPLNLGSNSVTNAVMGLDKLGGVALTGFYASNTNKAEVSGIFSARINTIGQISNLIKTAISKRQLDAYASQRETRINEGTQRKKDLTDFENLKVNDIVYNAGGSFVVLGEQRFVESFTTSSSSGSRTSYKYYYKNIVVFKSDAEGNMHWMHVLRKDQFGVMGKESMSYFNFMKNGKHYLFFIDHFSNLKKDMTVIPDRYIDGKKNFLYLTSFTIEDTTGTVNKEPILTGRDIRNSRLDNLEVAKAAMTNKDILVFEASDGSKNSLLLKVIPK